MLSNIFFLSNFLLNQTYERMTRHFLIVLVYTLQFFYFNFFELRFDIGIPALPPWPFHLLLPGNLLARVCVQHGLRTPNEAFFHPNSKLLGLGRQFGQINFGTFRVISADLSALILILSVPCPMFSINQPLFLQNTKPLYPNPKYLFVIVIWIWVSKN